MNFVQLYGWIANDLLDKYLDKKELFGKLMEKDLPFIYDAETDNLYIGFILNELSREEDTDRILICDREKLFHTIYETFDFWKPKDLPSIYPLRFKLTSICNQDKVLLC